MPGIFKIKNLQDAEFTLMHPDGVGAVSIASNNIAKIDAVNAALALKANTADLKELGVGQAWQSFTVGTQRISGTTYTNSTGKPITVFLNINIDTGGGATMVINGLSTSINVGYSGVAIPYTIIVPNGNTYQITAPQGISIWAELR